jgi:hypothetical protein
MSSIKLPRFLPVYQHFPDLRLADVRAAVQQELNASGLANRVPPGARVAIGVGSRGISNLAAIVGTVVDYWKSHGCRPFLFPAMGSHGGATAEGQRDVMARYGIDEQTMGCPVVSSMDVVSTGKTESGIPTFADMAAMESDGILLINRIKWHTSFLGPVESGLTKMAGIGLGKINGARHCHRHARSLGMENVIQQVARHNIATGKILGGVAILEDANHNTAKIAVVPADCLIEHETELLSLVQQWKAKIPMPLEILVLDEIGKNISGTGMDPKVVNRGVHGQYNPWPGIYRIQRILVRDLSATTHGNAVGVGMADIVHDRAVSKIDTKVTWVNTATSGSLAAARLPMHYPSDRVCLEILSQTVESAPEDATIGWIRNSLELGEFAFSENLRAEIEANPALEIAGPPFELDFDDSGNLMASPVPSRLH